MYRMMFQTTEDTHITAARANASPIRGLEVQLLFNEEIALIGTPTLGDIEALRREQVALPLQVRQCS